MAGFAALDITSTGLNMSELWMEVLAHNIANVNTIRDADQEPFGALMLQVQEDRGGPSPAGGGVRPLGLRESQLEAVKAFDPNHPLADDEGYVIQPVVDLAGQMTDLIAATRLYQLNLQVLQASRDAYEAAMRIGR